MEKQKSKYLSELSELTLKNRELSNNNEEVNQQLEKTRDELKEKENNYQKQVYNYITSGRRIECKQWKSAKRKL